MLINFKISNYKSINELNLDLSFAEGKAPNGYAGEKKHIFLESGKTRVVPCLAIFGANASGKSNVFDALRVFRAIIIDDIDNAYFPNKLVADTSSTGFEICFKYKKSIYEYKLEYDSIEITKEELKVDNEIIFHNSKEKIDFSQLPNKNYPMNKIKAIYDTECFNLINDVFYQKKTFLRVLAEDYGGLSEPISNCYQYIRRIIISNDNELFPITMIHDMLKEDNVDIMNEVTDLVKKLDISIDSINIESTEYSRDGFIKNINMNFKRPSTDNIRINPKTKTITHHKIFTIHKNIEGKEIRFEANEESNGTQVLLSLIPTLLFALHKGIPVIVDELDCSLHPFIVIKLIELFKDKDYNKNNAQLIFTTHTTDILEDNLMRKSEVATLTKTLKKGSVIRRVSDFEDIRNVSDFRKRYLRGELYGIPQPYI